MSKLLKETLIDTKKDNFETMSSETGFLETFVIKNENLDFKNVNIKLRSSPAYNYKCLNKVHEEPRYKGKIIFPIIETIILDKGQINHWIFTDEKAGYVLKKNSNKLVKDYILRYFVKVALKKIIEKGKKVEKNVDTIVEDIHRFVILSDQNYSNKPEFGKESKYLKYFYQLTYIYLKFCGEVEKMVSVIDLFILLGDPNKITNLLVIQNFINIDKSKTIYCKFHRKNILAAKKFHLYTKINNYEEKPQEISDYEDDEDVNISKNLKSSTFHNSHKNSNIQNNYNYVNHNTNHSINNNNINNPGSYQNFNPNGSGTNFNSFNNNQIHINANLINQVNNTASHKNTHSKTSNTIGNIFSKKTNKIKDDAKYDDEEEKTKKQIDLTDLIALNDINLTEYIALISEPFVDLLEKSLGIFIYELIIMYHKDNNGNFFFRLSDNIICKSRRTPEEIEEENRLKNTMKNIFEKAIPKEIRKNVKKYEKITKNAFCFGEFCNFNIPKFFKNMNKFSKEDLDKYNNIDSKFIERDKNHDFAFILPYFIIKKAYDNENLVNIVLKAYSIFPKNFNPNEVFQQLNKQKQEEEERKEEENKREAERAKMEEKIKRLGINATYSEEVKNYLINEKKTKNSSLNTSKLNGIDIITSPAGKLTPGIMQKRNTSASITEKNKLNMDYKTLEKNILSQNVDESDEEQNITEGNKSGVTLYTPTPGKFLNFNLDMMYSKTHVCGNCNIIYMLIEDFLSHFEDGETQFKSLNKAKNLLLQGEKLRNPLNMGDNIDVDENNDNLLFREEKTAFSLKKILKKKIKEEKLNEMMKNKPFVHQKLYKKIITKKDEFKKLFNYNIKMNPKLLQLNLLAEKSKNKFFNLILNELKNDPKSLNEKMGMQKPKRGFPKSLESLRMHMGINSKIMINSEYKSILNLNSAKHRSESKDSHNVYNERLSAYRKSANEVKINNNAAGNINNSFNCQDVNIFQEYMKIKLNYKPVIKRINSQVVNSNLLKATSKLKKNNQDEIQELSELEKVALNKKNNFNNMNKIKQIDEINAEKDMESYPEKKKNKLKYLTKKYSNSSKIQFNENSLDEPINSSDSKDLDVYKKKISKNENTYNDNLSDDDESSNPIDSLEEKAKDEEKKEHFIIKKQNTHNIYSKNNQQFKNLFNHKTDQEKIRERHSLVIDETNKKGIIQFKNKNNLKENPSLERKSSFDHYISQRRNSMIAFKKYFMKICLNNHNLQEDKLEENINNKINQTKKEKEDNLKDDNKIKKNITRVSQPSNDDIFKIANKNANQLNENNKIFFDIYQYFFPLENRINSNEGGSNQNFLKNEFQSNEIYVIINQDLKNKHYESDTDIPKMRKFVYEKLENINKEVVLKSKKKKNYKKYLSKQNKSNKNYNEELLEGNLGDEDQKISDDNSYLSNNKYLINHQIRDFNLNKQEIRNENTNYQHLNNEESSISKINKFTDSNNFEKMNDSNLKKANDENEKSIKDSKNLSRISEENKNSNENQNNILEKIAPKKVSLKTQEFSKKSYISSIFYYDWAKDPNKYEVPYYFFTTPLMRLNENNAPTNYNPLDEMKTINFEDLISIGKFSLIHIPPRKQKIFKKSKVFVIDQYTAIPYLITDLRYLNNKDKKKNNIFDNNNNNDEKRQEENNNNNVNINKNGNYNSGNMDNAPKKSKILVLVLNDFFDCFSNHYELITNALKIFKDSAERFKIINFNFPAQPFTLYNKKNIFNNIYFSKFLDRFLFHLMEKNIFDHTYSIIFMGFGNGGHVALNYVAANEKFFDFINSVIMLNSYCENDENIGKSMLEISKVIENSKNENMIDFFIKSITYNPLFLTQFNNFNINKKSNLGIHTLPHIENNQINTNLNGKNNKNIIPHCDNKINYQPSEIINKINYFIPITKEKNSHDYNYSNYNASNFSKNIHKNNINQNNNIQINFEGKDVLSNLNNIKDINDFNFQRAFENNLLINPIEEGEIRLSYQGYNLITKGYFYNIPFNFGEINTPIVAFHTSNNCFIPLTNLNNLFINSCRSNIDFSGLNNFAVKDPRSTMNPISSFDDFSELNIENKNRRKLVVTEGAHNLIKENSEILTKFLRNFFEYSFEYLLANKKNSY